jgi:hypothetical protein
MVNENSKLFHPIIEKNSFKISINIFAFLEVSYENLCEKISKAISCQTPEKSLVYNSEKSSIPLPVLKICYICLPSKKGIDYSK